MQLHKMKNCAKVIKDGDEATEGSRRLSLNELANLFGFLRTDDNGRIISVEADYDDAAEWEAAGREDSESGSQ